MTIGEIVEFDGLNKEVEEVQEPEKAVTIIERYENIITKRKGMINVAYHQGQVFKRFKEKEKFSVLGIHKTTYICKINVFKLCKKYPKLLTFFIGLEFFKNYYKDFEASCEENEKDFQC